MRTGAYDIDLSEIQQDYEADGENVVAITDQLAKVTEDHGKRQNGRGQSALRPQRL